MKNDLSCNYCYFASLPEKAYPCRKCKRNRKLACCVDYFQTAEQHLTKDTKTVEYELKDKCCYDIVTVFNSRKSNKIIFTSEFDTYYSFDELLKSISHNKAIDGVCHILAEDGTEGALFIYGNYPDDKIRLKGKTNGYL